MGKIEKNESHMGTFVESSEDRDKKMGSSKDLKKVDIKDKNIYGMVPKDLPRWQEELIRRGL